MAGCNVEQSDRPRWLDTALSCPLLCAEAKHLESGKHNTTDLSFFQPGDNQNAMSRSFCTTVLKGTPSILQVQYVDYIADPEYRGNDYPHQDQLISDYQANATEIELVSTFGFRVGDVIAIGRDKLHRIMDIDGTTIQLETPLTKAFGSGTRVDVDVDECDTGAHTCDGKARCTNIFGSFECSVLTPVTFHLPPQGCTGAANVHTAAVKEAAKKAEEERKAAVAKQKSLPIDRRREAISCPLSTPLSSLETCTNCTGDGASTSGNGDADCTEGECALGFRNFVPNQGCSINCDMVNIGVLNTYFIEAIETKDVEFKENYEHDFLEHDTAIECDDGDGSVKLTAWFRTKEAAAAADHALGSDPTTIAGGFCLITNDAPTPSPTPAPTPTPEDPPCGVQGKPECL